jgi:hypothetical protein
MRARVLFSFVLTAVAAVGLVSASSAATTKMSQLSRIDVSTRAAVVDYLHAIHVNPSGVVIERGSYNYAGANCPGTGWTCTSTKHTVVQVARAGGLNTFSCSRASCAVVQFAPTAVNNTARCIKRQGLIQACSITQSNLKGGFNTAIVYEKAAGSEGVTQTAALKATITQRSTSGPNRVCVYQETALRNSTKVNRPVTLRQDSHQSVRIKQDSTTGKNLADSSAFASGACDTAHPITQNQTLTARDQGHGTVIQNQNATSHGANVTIDIEQNQGVAHGVASGINDANFVQNSMLKAVADSSNGPIRQTQSSLNGGLLGTLHQDSSGGSTANATQHETQCEDAAKAGLAVCHQSDPDASEAPPSLKQIEFGPVRKGLGSSTQTRGGSADTFNVDQTSQQDNDQGSGSRQTEDVEGECVTDGNCGVIQMVIVDGLETDNFAFGQIVDATTSCTGSACQTGGGDGG